MIINQFLKLVDCAKTHLKVKPMIWLTALLVLGFCKEANAQSVSPVQGGHYLASFIGVRDMATPPPGLFVIVYNYRSSTNSFYDRNGDKFSGGSLSNLDPSLPDINVDINLDTYATVPVIAWGSKKTILGGARYLAGIAPVIAWADASLVTEQNGGTIIPELNQSVSGKLSGFSDLLIFPLGLSWGFEKTDLTFMYSVTAPTGKYENGGSENLGLGFWTNQFQGFGYYYPVADKSSALMLGLTYEINGKIKDSDVKPGNRFTLEYGISQYLSERFELGIIGGHNWQISDDKGSDVFWDPSVRDRKSTLAFTAGYWVWKQRMQLTFKYGFDYGMRQRFKNDALMLNLTFVTNALTGANKNNNTQ